MILTRAILKTMFVCCHSTNSLKNANYQKNMAVSPHFGEIFFIIILDIFFLIIMSFK